MVTVVYSNLKYKQFSWNVFGMFPVNKNARLDKFKVANFCLISVIYFVMILGIFIYLRLEFIVRGFP